MSGNSIAKGENRQNGLAARRRVGSAPDAPHTIVVKGLRECEVAALDAVTDKRIAALSLQGATTSRNAVIVAIIREFIAREASA